MGYCTEKVYMDKQGVIRWTESHEEVALFGANYCLPSACDFRAADYVGGERKQMIVEDLEHFKPNELGRITSLLLGRLSEYGSEGNLQENEHLHLLDYLIAEADKRDIYMLLSPIVTYNSQWYRK